MSRLGPGGWLLGLLLLPGLCGAGVTYQMSIQSFGRLADGPSSSTYAVEGDRIRVETSDGHTVFIFRDGETTVLDKAKRTAQVLHHATVAENARQLEESVKRLEELATSAPTDRRDKIDQAIAINKDMAARYRQPPLRDYRKTDRVESSEGRPCHVWEVLEQGAKWLELCVASTAEVPRGAEVLVGMRALSTYLNGGMFAVGVELGLAPRWSEIEALGGVPVIVREFRRGQLVTETYLTGFRARRMDSVLFEVPSAYAVADDRT